MNKSSSKFFSLPAFLIWSVLVFLPFTSAFAQYFQFGKNRVQYNSFDWRFIQSDHFDVYYYSSLNYELADFTVRALESSLRQLSEDYRHEIANRIKVIIYDSHNDFSQTNVVALPTNSEGIGGVTDPFKNRITMPFSGDYTEFRSTLQHELTHAVFNDMFYGGSLQNIINSNIQLVLPNWFDEGMAEYTSLGWDTQTDMYIRDAIINNYLPDIPRLFGFFAYRGGQSMWNFIAEEYGRQKIGEILEIIKSQRSIEVGFKRGLGLSTEELSEQWKDYYRKRYLPEVAEREDLDNFATLITERRKFGTFNTSPAVSPRGDKIALITNARSGLMDVVVVSAITGEKLKTVIKGQSSIQFEELNILHPNLSWSPDGTKLTLSAKSKGSDDLAIVDYETGKIRKIKFPRLDAIGSVSWSPDSKKIAFDGNIGPYQDIFVYNLETQEFLNITNDVITDYGPAWSEDSETIYFTSSRGDKVQLNTYKENYRLLLDDDLYTTDIYSVKIGANRATRLTKTPKWSEKQPATTQEGRLVFISDQNGIPNVYQINLEDRTTSPLTNLQTGVMQMSISADGSRLAVNSLNEGYLDVFLIKSPFTRKKDSDLSDNEWAQRRNREPVTERVPATKYVRQMFGTAGSTGQKTSGLDVDSRKLAQKVKEEQEAAKDTVTADTTRKDDGQIDFRNYVFANEVAEDSAFIEKYLDEAKFRPKNNLTDDGRYQPRNYRLNFSVDFAYATGNFSTFYGTSGLTQIVFSDLLGDHQIAFGSNLVFDLRNSDYFIQYGYYKNRTNWTTNFYHSAISFQTFSGQLFRFRYNSFGVNGQYPIDKFRRVDFGLSGIGIAQDVSFVFRDSTNNEKSAFVYPQVTYTTDKTIPGFITPRGGHRYSVSLNGSPPIAQSLEFVSLLGDFRKYVNLGRRYSIALRGSGAASFGQNSQTFFMGGMLGWINQRFSDNAIPIDELGESFFTLPALPLRGYEFNTINGDKFTLLNAEFRFPLFAAVLPGPLPLFPLYNLTGVAFVDAGTAWGKRIEFDTPQTNLVYHVNESDLDFRLRQVDDVFVDPTTGDIVENPANPNDFFRLERPTGDVVIGAGFGLRTILFGLPFRYDIGWPYYRDGFDGDAIHYFSIGIDF